MLKKTVLFAAFLIIGGIAFAGDVSAPIEPTVGDIVVPEVRQPSLDTNSLQKLVLLKATAVFSGSQSWKGLAYLSNDTALTVTNITPSGVEIKVLSFYNIESVRVTKWAASRTGTNDQYLFLPSEYRIVGVGTDTNGLVYRGNIPVFNQFVFSDDKVKKVLYTYFYDNWIQGKKGFFRWENSKTDNFSFNFNNPLPWVVTEILFDRNF